MSEPIATATTDTATGSTSRGASGTSRGASGTTPLPVVAVHGFMDTGFRIASLIRGLDARGVTPIHEAKLRPVTGAAPLEVLAEQLEAFVEQVRGTGSDGPAGPEIDVVGFSMGALVSRIFLQRFGGAQRVRRFVSISGPHRGTWAAYGLRRPAGRQMRPRSPLLRELGRDVSALSTEVHCIYTPFDLMVLPATTAVLEGAKSVHRIPVRTHSWMVSDPRVLDLCVSLLAAPEATR